MRTFSQFIVLSICILFASYLFADCKTNIKLTEVNSLLDKAMYTEAEVKLLQVTKECPSNSLALSYLADIYKINGDVRREAAARGALEASKASAAKESRAAWGNALLALVFLSLGGGLGYWYYQNAKEYDKVRQRKSELYSTVTDIRGKLEEELTKLKLVGSSRQLLGDVKKGHEMCLEIISIGLNDLDDLDIFDTLRFIDDCESLLWECKHAN